MDLVVNANGVSRRHAVLDSTGPTTVIVDAGSSNGTWVNGTRVSHPRSLENGDLVQLGIVVLQYVDAASAGPERLANATGVAPGLAATDDNYPGTSPDERFSYSSANDLYAAGRDQTFDHRRQHFGDNIGHLGSNVRVQAEENPWDEIFSGRGPGRVIAIIGALVSLAGFALFASTIFGTMTQLSSGDNTSRIEQVKNGTLPAMPSPLDATMFGDVPTIFVGFGAFFVGGVVTVIGLGMSRAARRRQQGGRGQ